MKGRFGLSHWYNESIRTVLRNARQRSGLPQVNLPHSICQQHELVFADLAGYNWISLLMNLTPY